MTIHYAPPTVAHGARAVFPANSIVASDPAHGGGAPRSGAYRAWVKRTLDVALVLLSAPLTLPLLAFLALLASLDGAGPFYRQQRLGRGGRLYSMWKLRTMVPDADARLEGHLQADPEARAEWESTQKLKHDPRITRMGRLLRKSSLDELPQLWNVLKGDMSLVGPRPMLPEQAPLYPGRAYYALRPGITGPWQVSSRNQTTFAERAWFDTGYERALSLATDLRLLASTLRVVVRGTGY